MPFHFQWRGTDSPLFFVYFCLSPEGYGRFDYRLLQWADYTEMHFSEEGLRAMHDFGRKQLIEDDTERRTVLEDLSAYEISLRSFIEPRFPNGADAAHMKKIWKDFLPSLKELFIRFGVVYVYSEQPLLAPLEDVIAAAASREGMQMEEVFKNHALATGFTQKEKTALETITIIGKKKWEIHELIEKPLRALTKIFHFIAEDSGSPYEMVQTMTYDDILAYMEGKPLPASVLKERTKGVVLLPRAADGFFKIETGTTFAHWEKVLKRPLQGDIRGTVVFRGKARGTVKMHLGWIGISEIPPGSVLVTSMTNPQMMPYLKNAAAIVTDEGGLMSHAAVVAREMKIPCIVGTRVATQVLKDGDLVEVDAERGVVRILEKAH